AARAEVPGRAVEPAAPSAPDPAEGAEGDRPSGEAGRGGAAEDVGGVIRMGTYRDLWAAEVTDRSPALRFLAPKQTLEIAPADAERLGLGSGEQVDVRSNGTSVRARVAIRERVRPGSGFLIEGTRDANANAIPPGARAEVAKAG